MADSSVITIILLVSSTVYGRGPHHPRGENIVKHHVHYRPTKGVTVEKLTQDIDLLHDKEHIHEELGEWANTQMLETMTDEELEFHYFNIHDLDRNRHLDGLEMLQAIRHTVDHDDDEDNDNEIPDEFSLDHKEFSYFVEIIDKVFEEDDADNDGYLSYAEYVNAKKKDPDTVYNELVLGPKLLTNL